MFLYRSSCDVEQDALKRVKRETFVVRVAGLSHDKVPASWIETTFKRYGEIYSIDHEVSDKEEHTVFIYYATHKAAQTACLEMNGETVADRVLSVQHHHLSSQSGLSFAPPCKNPVCSPSNALVTNTTDSAAIEGTSTHLSSIKLTNIPHSVKEATLLSRCKEIAGVSSLKLVQVDKGSTNYAWVTVSSNNAELVQRVLNGMILDGNEIRASQPRPYKVPTDQELKVVTQQETSKQFSFKLLDNVVQPTSSLGTVNPSMQKCPSLPETGSSSLFQPIRYGLDLTMEHAAMLTTLPKDTVHFPSDKAHETELHVPPSLKQSNTQPLMLCEAASLIGKFDEQSLRKVGDIPKSPPAAVKRSQTVGTVSTSDQSIKHSITFSKTGRGQSSFKPVKDTDLSPKKEVLEHFSTKQKQQLFPRQQLIMLPEVSALPFSMRSDDMGSSIASASPKSPSMALKHISNTSKIQGSEGEIPQKGQIPSLQHSKTQPIMSTATTVFTSIPCSDHSRSPPTTLRHTKTAHATSAKTVVQNIGQSKNMMKIGENTGTSSKDDGEQNPFKKALARRPSPVLEVSIPPTMKLMESKKQTDTVHFKQSIIKRTLVMDYKTELKTLQKKYKVMVSGEEVDGLALTIIGNSEVSIMQAKKEILALAQTIDTNISDIIFTMGCEYLPCLANSDTVTQLQAIEKQDALEVTVLTVNSEMNLTECSALLKAKMSESKCPLCLSQVHSLTEMRLGYFWKVRNATTGEVVGFENDINMQINMAYIHREVTCNFLYSGHSYTVDFTEMTVTDQTIGGQVHSLIREPVWCRYTSDEFGYKPLRESISAIIESTFQQGAPGFIEIEGQQCVIDFDSDPMQAYSVSNVDNSCSIQRQPQMEEVTLAPVLSIRVRGIACKLMTAKQAFCNTLQAKVTTEPLKIPTNVCSKVTQLLLLTIARQYCVQCVLNEDRPELQLTGTKEIVTDVSRVLMQEIMMILSEGGMVCSKPTIPPNWVHQTKDVELCSVEKGSSEWTHIKDLMNMTLKSVKIKSIQRIQNRYLWQKYDFFRKSLINKMNGKSINEKELFHGTRSNHPSNIYESDKGFDFRFGSGNSLWGQGSYFAVNASYSDRNYTYSLPGGVKQLILASVVTGESVYMPNPQKLNLPPLKQGKKNERYDTVQATTGGSEIYVVYDHEKAYPAYLITYRT